MVERWSINGFTYCPVKRPDGLFVRYSDYAALEAQLAELAAENERLTRLNNGLYDELQFMRSALKARNAGGKDAE